LDRSTAWRTISVSPPCYLAGAGFWEINWGKALEYYSNAYLNAPNMYDNPPDILPSSVMLKLLLNMLISWWHPPIFAVRSPIRSGIFHGANDAIAPTATAAIWLVTPRCAIALMFFGHFSDNAA
jgi:hypothetical protein